MVMRSTTVGRAPATTSGTVVVTWPPMAREPTVAASAAASMVTRYSRAFSCDIGRRLLVAPKVSEPKGSSGLSQRLDHGGEGRLRLMLTVPEQRVIHALTVQPGIRVTQPPEGHAGHRVPMLEKDAEDVGVAAGGVLLHLLGAAPRGRSCVPRGP